MTFAEELRASLVRLVDLLEAAGVPYVLMGGIVVSIWGVPRATYDLDVTLDADPAKVEAFLKVAKDAGFTVDSPFERGFRDVLSGMEKLRLEWWTSGARRIEVDVFLVTTPYQKAAFERRVRARIDGREAWVLTPADLVLHKLVAGRPKDRADVQNLLMTQGVPEPGHLRSWAQRLGVEAALDAALREAGH
jgi:hypothetical protein